LQVIQDGLELIGTLQLLVYADCVIMLRGSVHSINENAEDFQGLVRRLY